MLDVTNSAALQVKVLFQQASTSRNWLFLATRSPNCRSPSTGLTRSCRCDQVPWEVCAIVPVSTVASVGTVGAVGTVGTGAELITKL
jgi:hypothetical protein